MENLSGLTDQELISELDSLARREREALPHFLACLSEVERRGLHLELGHQNLFDYCVGRLRFSEAGAMRRIHAARAASKHPEIYTLLRSGELNLAVVALLSPHLNSTSAASLLEQARGKSKREIETLVVSLAHARVEADTPAPESDPPVQDELGLWSGEAVAAASSEQVHGLRAPADASPVSTTGELPVAQSDETPFAPLDDPPFAPAEEVPAPAVGPLPTPPSSPPTTAVAPATVTAALASPDPEPNPSAYGEQLRPPSAPAPPAFRRDSIRLEAPGILRVSFQAAVAFGEKLERVRGLLGRRSGRVESILDIVLTEYLTRHDPFLKQRSARRTTAQRTRRVVRWVRDIVWRRDGGRCAYLSPDGVRCSAKSRLEYDHIQPWALGGASDDPSNIRLLCRAHNLRAARKIFGDRVPEGRLPSG